MGRRGVRSLANRESACAAARRLLIAIADAAQESRSARQRSRDVTRRLAAHRRDQRPGIRGRRRAGSEGGADGAPDRRAEALRETGWHSRIYANDNFGRWQSDFQKVVQHCLEDGVRGEEVARILQPEDDDYFVLKPKHSAFYGTTLDVLLQYLDAKTLILTGIAGNICILFSANDAYMRDFNLFVPSDCVVSNTDEENQHALDQIQKVLKADVTPSTSLDLTKMLSTSGR
jgi:nicotinamidase-related amidase